MAHRPTALPHPPQIRDQYTPPTPTFRRPSEHAHIHAHAHAQAHAHVHAARSPSFPSAGTLRRQPLSPTPSLSAAYGQLPVGMDPNYGPKSSQSIPPLKDLTTLGTLQHTDGSGHQIKVDITGTIDKGFFLSDGEWTCYRRNYFSCICSYSLTPHYPQTGMQFTPNSSQQSYQVHALAMSISAVVSDNDGHTIDLVQHTPKRDKGPMNTPSKVPMLPKPQGPSHHPVSLYSGHPHGTDPTSLPGLTSRMYDQPFGAAVGSGSGSVTTEHTFERIQFKHATANNGKRRAAQQYYHLLVELWADVGNQSPDKYVRVAYRKSEKMIVRGRSPGHYQNERRGSASSGPPAPGSMGYGGAGMMGGDFSSPGGGQVMGGGYASGSFDGRSSVPYSTRQHSHHSDMASDEMDVEAKPRPAGYQYFPGTIYAGQTDPRDGVDMFTHQPRTSTDTDGSGMPSVKSDYSSEAGSSSGSSSGLPSLFHNGPLATRRCGPFDGKSRSDGYYPTMVPQPPQPPHLGQQPMQS
jgi:meiosis-specific transcription factor NDT80